MKQSPQKTKNKIGWKIFFWFNVTILFLLFCILGFELYLFAKLKTAGSHKELYSIVKEAFPLNWKELLLSYPLMVITTVGLYGFAYDKKIFFRKIWLYVLTIYIVSNIYDIVTIDLTDIEPDEMFSLLAVVMAFTLPLYILEILFLYRYSLKSPKIWEQAKP